MDVILKNKSTNDEIEKRFDNYVERFLNIETGQATTIDAEISMELITQAAVNANCNIQNVLDIGCGAGNNVIKLSQAIGESFNVDLVDLSQPMLNKAKERVQEVNSGIIATYKGDIREIPLDEGKYDVITAAAVLHHLRDDSDWEAVFSKIYSLLAVGGRVD